MKRAHHITLGFLLATFFTWLIFRKVNIAEAINAFSDTNLNFLVLAVIFFFAGYAFRIERWRLMLVQENPTLLWKNCAGPLMASVAANNILPLRAGDFLRVFAFNHRLGISTATSLATLYVERLLDLLMVLIFLGFALTWFGLGSSLFISSGIGFLLIAGTAGFVFLILPSVSLPIILFFSRLLFSFSPTLAKRILPQLHKVYKALDLIRKSLIMMKLFYITILAWMAEGFVFWFVALSLPSISNHLAAWLALPIGTLATVIPSTPGYFGTFDYLTSQAMSALGNKWTSSIAFTYLIHFVLWAPPSIVGALYLIMHPIDRKKVPLLNNV